MNCASNNRESGYFVINMEIYKSHTSANIPYSILVCTALASSLEMAITVDYLNQFKELKLNQLSIAYLIALGSLGPPTGLLNKLCTYA